jgi:hypothetical protein
MAPEMLEGEEYDFRLDNYGVALVAYYLLTGEDAFGSDTVFGLARLQNAITARGVVFDPSWANKKTAKTAIELIIDRNFRLRVPIKTFLGSEWMKKTIENVPNFYEKHQKIINSFLMPPPPLMGRTRKVFQKFYSSPDSSLFSPIQHK